MNDSRPSSNRWTAVCRRLAFALLLLAVGVAAPAVGLAQDDEKEKPEPQKEWVIGYALLTLPMAGAMYFMFRMNKRHDFKVKKEEGDD